MQFFAKTSRVKIYRIPVATFGKFIRLLYEFFARAQPSALWASCRSRVYFSFGQTFWTFADMFLPDGSEPARVPRRPTRGSRSHESSENNRRSNRATGFCPRRRFVPSNVSSSAASLVTSLTQFRARQRHHLRVPKSC